MPGRHSHFFRKTGNKNFIERGDCFALEMDLLLQAYPFQGRHYTISTLITDFQ